MFLIILRKQSNKSKLFEVSTQTEGGYEPILFSKSVSTQSDDFQESTFVVNSDDKKHQTHEPTETILFADDVVQVRQGELVLLDQITGSRSKFEIRNFIIPTNTQLDSSSQFQFDDDEIDKDEMPELINQDSGQMMGSDVFKVQ
jgi:hypothetical protein